MWRLHVHFFPEHRPYERQFWGSGISPGAFASSFLMLMPLALPATVLGFLAANCLVWLIPPARRSMQGEAAGDKEMTFSGSNSGLIKWGTIPSIICVILSIIGAVTLRSLR
jgi:hypothetical protein